MRAALLASFSLLLLCAAPMAACGGRVDPLDGAAPGPSSTATAVEPQPAVTTTTLFGSFKGETVIVHDAIAFRSVGAGETQLVIAYTDGMELCRRLMANEQEPETRYLSVVLIADGATGDGGPAAPSIAPGSYTVTSGAVPQADGSTLFVSGGFSSLDVVCHNNEVENVAESGTVSLASVGDRVSGSFDFAFATGDAFHGTFDVPLCPVMLPAATPATCTP